MLNKVSFLSGGKLLTFLQEDENKGPNMKLRKALQGHLDNQSWQTAPLVPEVKI